MPRTLDGFAKLWSWDHRFIFPNTYKHTNEHLQWLPSIEHKEMVDVYGLCAFNVDLAYY